MLQVCGGVLVLVSVSSMKHFLVFSVQQICICEKSKKKKHCSLENQVTHL